MKSFPAFAAIKNAGKCCCLMTVSFGYKQDAIEVVVFCCSRHFYSIDESSQRTYCSASYKSRYVSLLPVVTTSSTNLCNKQQRRFAAVIMLLKIIELSYHSAPESEAIECVILLTPRINYCYDDDDTTIKLNAASFSDGNVRQYYDDDDDDNTITRNRQQVQIFSKLRPPPPPPRFIEGPCSATIRPSAKVMQPAPPFREMIAHNNNNNNNNTARPILSPPPCSRHRLIILLWLYLCCCFVCVPRVSASTDVSFHIPGDIILGGVFPVHEQVSEPVKTRERTIEKPY